MIYILAYKTSLRALENLYQKFRIIARLKKIT